MNSNAKRRMQTLIEILAVSARLGLTSFGGPAAHLGYFHDEYVRRRKWLDERSYADLVALCQFLPGPASSQVGIGIGVMRSGLWGGLAAWLGFTLPSVVAMVLFALLLHPIDPEVAGWIHGLKIVAVAVVAQAVWGMGQKLASDRMRATIAIAAAAALSVWPTSVSQIAVIVLAGAAGYFLLSDGTEPDRPPVHVPLRRSVAVGSLVLFFGLLVLLPLVRNQADSFWLSVFDIFYRAGSLVFGGGHVVLPLLEREVVPLGWVGQEAFLAGYGAAQAVPGPLFTFVSYLGAVMGGWTGAAIATAAVFLPGYLLVVGALPFWDLLRRHPHVQGALAGVNAAVVGILLAALYHPIWTGSIQTPLDFALAAALFGMLQFWKRPPWMVVLAGALGGSILSLMS